MARFVGTYVHTMDSQNRVAIPAKVRAELGESFIMTVSPDHEGCLYCYSNEDWDDVTDKLLEDTPTEFTTMRQRMIAINSERIDVKNKGLITIPARFVNEIGFKDEVYMVGNIHRLELWTAEKYAEMLEEAKEILKGQKTFFYK